jgi:hypothetical protein
MADVCIRARERASLKVEGEHVAVEREELQVACPVRGRHVHNETERYI